MQITATGNFIARPNKATAPGLVVDYHFHRFDHTVLPFSGLWKVMQYEYEHGEEYVNPDRLIAETYMAPKLFIPKGMEVAPWVLIQKDRWHRIELISKSLYVGDLVVEVDECEFWCCFSIRDHTGGVVEYQTGWAPAFE